MMKTTPKLFSFLTLSALICALVAMPAQAAPAEHGLLQSRVKVALNDMVADVRAADNAEAKRAVLERYLDKFESRAQLAGRLPLDDEHRAALTSLQTRFAGYSQELRGDETRAGVADGDLDAFASFMQHDLEQAASTWGSGGIYLSTGAVIIILLILILIT